MFFHKSNQQKKLYKAVVAQAFRQPKGKAFTYNDLVVKTGLTSISTNDQREVGRRFAYLVKHANLPFAIIDSQQKPILYLRL
ncbi:hypothetical protein KYI11_00280 [Macrococcoides bohemicum]|uniref:Uncharacterized protein n=1 Tax=Macrococcoides bohemicum TaxID=1903056 RepID=A0AAE7Q7Y6_9STAP|nr:hypothetical protein [Macrococcus bohemicus]QRN48634.1 hypothetical protein HT586_00280 [Macrococcus bohemicus]QYA42431.1 hypothetical protein KYI11_00280 [Macrococcus bohemicus]